MARISLRKAQSFTLASSVSLVALVAITPVAAQQVPVPTQELPTPQGQTQPSAETPAPATAPAPAVSGAQPLPPVTVTQPQPAPATQVSKPKKPKVAIEPDDEPPAKPAKPKVVAKKKPMAKPKPKPQPEPVEAAAPPPPQPDPATVAPANALGTYNPALDLPGLTLPPGTTLTTAGPVDGYRALSAMSSTKTATPIERIPQSIQIVPRTVIEDQTSISVDETVRNVSNVQSFNDLNIGNTDMAGAKIRGLKAEIWLDGMVVNYNTGDKDAFANVERIEVLKGPSAILYGGGSGAPAGGAINIISKLPTDKAGGEFGVTLG